MGVVFGSIWVADALGSISMTSNMGGCAVLTDIAIAQAGAATALVMAMKEGTTNDRACGEGKQ